MAIATVVRSLMMNSAKPSEPFHSLTFMPSRVNATVDVKSSPGIGRAWSTEGELDGEDGIFRFCIVDCVLLGMLVDIGDEQPGYGNASNETM